MEEQVGGTVRRLQQNTFAARLLLRFAVTDAMLVIKEKPGCTSLIKDSTGMRAPQASYLETRLNNSVKPEFQIQFTR